MKRKAKTCAKKAICKNGLLALSSYSGIKHYNKN